MDGMVSFLCFADAMTDLVPAASADLLAALIAGGDSRLVVDTRTGTNKYLCPPAPAPDLLCLSSCTASPVTARGFRRAAGFYAALMATRSALGRSQALEHEYHQLSARLLGYFGVADIAEAILCQSGTDALLAAATLVAKERPGEPITAILPAATETGTGVPLAVAGRCFDGVAPGGVSPQTLGSPVETVEIPLRSADGTPREDGEVVAAYAAAVSAARGRPIVYLTHSTKTGLIAPVVPPAGADVIVDACQARIAPATVARYLRQGWPVVVTGSKFFGGPAFAGAVLVPTARWSAGYGGDALLHGSGAANLGMVLRWIAALDAIEAFGPMSAAMSALLKNQAAAIEAGLACNPALQPIGALVSAGHCWSALPSIFTFAVRDPANRNRLLSATELRPLYERLARGGILLGQPVSVGSFGGLRIAVGARDLLPDAPDDGGLARLFLALKLETECTRTG